MNQRNKNILIGLLICMIGIYIVTAYIMLDINPLHWNFKVRCIYGFSNLLLPFIIALFTIDSDYPELY